MAFPTAVNNQITDSVQVNGAQASNGALDNLYQAVAQALANAAQNAVTVQQQGAVTAQAATTMIVSRLLSADNPAGAPEAKPQAAPETAALTDITARAIAQAVEEANALTEEGAGDWARAVREVMGAAAASLRELQAVAQQGNLAVVKQTAIAMALERMIQAPEQLEQYQKVIEVIEGL